MQCSDGAAVQFTPNCPLSDGLSDFMEGPLLITFHPANGCVKPQIRPEPNECGARGVRRVEHVDVDRQVKGCIVDPFTDPADDAVDSDAL